MKKEKPLILLSNDDGVEAKGLNELIRGLRGMGEIILMAPDGQRKKNGFKINRTVFYLSIGFPKSCKIIASKPKNSTVRSFRASFASFWIVDNSML